MGTILEPIGPGFSLGANCDCVKVKGDYVYVSEVGYGIRIYNVSDKLNPSLVFSLPLSYTHYFVFSNDGNFLYTGIGRENRLKVYDSSDCNTLELLGSSSGGEGEGNLAEKISINYPYAYLWCPGNPGYTTSKVYNIANPTNPYYLKEFHPFPWFDVWGPGQYAGSYLDYTICPGEFEPSGEDCNWFGIYDKDMTNPAYVFPGYNNIEAVKVVGSTLFVMASIGGDYPGFGVIVYDISTPKSPVWISDNNLGLYHIYHLTYANGCLIASHYDGAPGLAGGASLIDISNLKELKVIARTSGDHSVQADGNSGYLYTTKGADGIRIYYSGVYRNARHYPRMRQIGNYDELFPPLDTDSNFHIDLMIKALQLDVADNEAIALFPETFPDSTTLGGLLLEWETLCGLDHDDALSFDERRNAVIAVLVSRGGMSKAYFKAVAAELGYSYGSGASQPRIWFVEGEQYLPFRADYSKAGDQVWDPTTNTHGHVVEIWGTGIASDTVLKNLFSKYRPKGIRFLYRSE